MRQAAAARPPSRADRSAYSLRADTKAALRECLRLGGRLPAWRKGQRRVLNQVRKALEPKNEVLRGLVDSPHGARVVAGDVNVALLCALVDALERFVGTCARAVETHGRAAREAAAKANAAAREAKAANKKGGRDAKAAAETAAAAAAAAASVERMQGMFVRCAAEVRRDLAMAVARAEARRGAGDGEGSE